MAYHLIPQASHITSCCWLIDCVPLVLSSGVVSSLLKSMQELPITAITQKEGGTQLKLIIDFEVLYTARAGHATML